MSPSSTSTGTPALKKYRVTLTEQVVYTIDVLAETEEQAEEIAIETEAKGEPKYENGDVDVNTVDDDDLNFDPVNPTEQA